MFSMPSRGRPHNLARFIAAYRETGAKHPLRVRLDLCDPALDAYAKLDYPAGWLVERGERLPNRCNGAVQEMFERFPSEPVYGLLADDLIPRTQGWDDRLVATAEDSYLAYADDGMNGENLATHPVLGGELVRAIGFLALPGLLHSFVDTALHTIAARAGRCRYLPDVLVEHMHPLAGKAEDDPIHRYKETYIQDAYVFWKWQGRGLRPIVERVKARFGGDLLTENHASVEHGTKSAA